MPLLRSDALPLSRDEVAELRARLIEPYQCETVDRDERRYLFVRCPGEEPDPVVDLERGCEEAPPWLVDSVSDVFLLGARVDLHVPAHYARPILKALARVDHQVAREARAQLDVHYGVRIIHVSGDPPNVERLIVRVPRDRCADLTELDLAHLAERVGPLSDLGSLRNIRTCHLVADVDHLRFRSRDFLADLVDRWLPIREARNQRTVPVPPAEPAPAPEPPAPKPVVDVTPLFELEVELVADGQEQVPEPEAAPTTNAPSFAADSTPPPNLLRDAETELAHTLTEAGYAVGRVPYLESSPFQLEGDRTVAFPHRIALIVRENLTFSEACEAVALARDHELDLLLILTVNPSSEAERRLSATKVKVIKTDEVAAFRP